ncbi:glutamate 5-kinase [Egibacter rhizosphaerae]|uniref:Glutamate 5-kinase n=1 Tax=Egibacter rhizosphaerae TaxID=1670831 RepID=A0A411YKX9_9ACTN|nr:glutamate 5-kinase [Egibacter rhizosphaerae]
MKVGSSSLRTAEGRLDADLATHLIDAVADLRERGVQVVFVSSGAVAAGLAPLGLRQRPIDLPRLQAAASVGQGLLVHTYQRRLAARGLAGGQVLLTPDDVVERARYLNARGTLETLLGLGAIPLVNENDTIATEELRFGDNDRLAALVASMLGAQLLVLLTDVDGFYEGGEVVPRLTELSSAIARHSRRPGSDVGSGGIASKLEAARIAAFSGAHSVIAHARAENVVHRTVLGEEIGTWCPPSRHRPESRKLWIAFARTPRGRIVVDKGAARALIERGSSLLAVGVEEAEGAFTVGDAVDVVHDGRVLGRGLSGLDRETVERVRGRPTEDLAEAGEPTRAVIHRDSLVVLPHVP